MAIKHDSNIDIVIAYRRKYLEQFGWSENFQRFIEYAKKVLIVVHGRESNVIVFRCFQQVDIDWDTIEEKLIDEL